MKFTAKLSRSFTIIIEFFIPHNLEAASQFSAERMIHITLANPKYIKRSKWW